MATTPYLAPELLLQIAEESMTYDFLSTSKELTEHRWNICKTNKLFCKAARSVIFQMQILELLPHVLEPAVEILGNVDIARNIKNLHLYLRIVDIPSLGKEEEPADQLQDLGNWTSAVSVLLTKLLSVCAPTLEILILDTCDDAKHAYHRTFNGIAVEVLSAYRFPRLKTLKFQTNDIGKISPFWTVRSWWRTSFTKIFNENMATIRNFSLGPGTSSQSDMREFETFLGTTLTQLQTLRLGYIGNLDSKDSVLFRTSALLPLSKLRKLYIDSSIIDGGLPGVLRELSLMSIEELELQNVGMNPEDGRWADVLMACLQKPLPFVEIGGLAYYSDDESKYCEWDRDTYCSPYEEDHVVFKQVSKMSASGTLPEGWQRRWTKCKEHYPDVN